MIRSSHNDAILTNTSCTVFNISVNQIITLKLLPGESYFLVPVGGQGRVVKSPTNQDVLLYDRVVCWMPFEADAEQQQLSIKILSKEHPAMEVYCVILSPKSDSEVTQVKWTRKDIPINVGSSLLFENEFVKVWDFSIGVNQHCNVHQHVHNYFFINLVHSTTQALDEHIQCQGEAATQKAGQITFVDLLSTGNPAIHAARNVGNEKFRQLIVEFI